MPSWDVGHMHCAMELQTPGCINCALKGPWGQVGIYFRAGAGHFPSCQEHSEVSVENLSPVLNGIFYLLLLSSKPLGSVLFSLLFSIQVLPLTLSFTHFYSGRIASPGHFGAQIIYLFHCLDHMMPLGVPLQWFPEFLFFFLTFQALLSLFHHLPSRLCPCFKHQFLTPFKR